MAITAQMIEQYQHPRIKLVVGSTTIYEDDIVSGSFSYKGGTTSGGAFAPGGCVISSCSVSVYNRHGEYSNLFTEGTQIAVYIGYGASPTTATYDLLCTVYVSELTKRSSKIMIQSFDKLRDADKKKWTGYSFPMTVNQIIQSAASVANITVSQLPPNTVAGGGGISVDLRDSDGNQPELSMTCRQAIAQALLIAGHYGYMTPSGQLYCGWYSASADMTIPNSWIFDFSVSDAQDYTGVQVYGQNPTGSSTRLYVLSSGRFITEDNCANIQARLYQALVASHINIRKGNFSAVCNPNIHAGMNIQATVPIGGNQTTMIIPITSITIKGSLKATYSAEAVSADQADDLRKADDYATKEDVDKAVKENLPEPVYEYLTLPSVKIWMAIDQNSNHVLATLRGEVLELQKQDDYHADIGQLIARNSSNPTQDEDGIDIMSITFPQQIIKIPAATGQEAFIEIQLGQVNQPTWLEYKAAFGNEFTEERRLARFCNFRSFDHLPYMARVRVKRYIGEGQGGPYNFITFSEDANRYSRYGSGAPIRTLVFYNGLDAPNEGYTTNPYPPTPRIPLVWLPLPGQCIDLEPSHTTTYKKWCCRNTQSIVQRNALRLISSDYIEYR